MILLIKNIAFWTLISLLSFAMSSSFDDLLPTISEKEDQNYTYMSY